MGNHPTHDHSAYFAAVSEAADELAEAQSHIRAEQDAGRISVAEAAVERVGLLERHLERLEQLRREHFGDPS
jgi:hypothetical protein